MTNESQKVMLEKVKIGLLVSLSPHLIDVKVSYAIDALTDEILFRLSGYLWGKHSAKETVRYPSDWWQAFKELWFPAWLSKRFPVRYTVHTFDVARVLPELRIPGAGQEVVLSIWHGVEDQ